MMLPYHIQNVVMAHRTLKTYYHRTAVQHKALKAFLFRVIKNVFTSRLAVVVVVNEGEEPVLCSKKCRVCYLPIPLHKSHVVNTGKKQVFEGMTVIDSGTHNGTMRHVVDKGGPEPF